MHANFCLRIQKQEYITTILELLILLLYKNDFLYQWALHPDIPFVHTVEVEVEGRLNLR